MHICMFIYYIYNFLLLVTPVLSANRTLWLRSNGLCARVCVPVCYIRYLQCCLWFFSSSLPYSDRSLSPKSSTVQLLSLWLFFPLFSNVSLVKQLNVNSDVVHASKGIGIFLAVWVYSLENWSREEHICDYKKEQK